MGSIYGLCILKGFTMFLHNIYKKISLHPGPLTTLIHSRKGVALIGEKFTLDHHCNPRFHIIILLDCNVEFEKGLRVSESQGQVFQ